MDSTVKFDALRTKEQDVFWCYDESGNACGYTSATLIAFMGKHMYSLSVDPVDNTSC